MKVFKTLEEILKAVDYELSVQQLINEKVHLKGLGWSKIELSNELKDLIINKTVDILGGHQKTKVLTSKALEFRTPQHWTLSRMFVNDYGNGARISYCAGQDYTSEMRTGRKAIKEMY